MEPFYQHSGFYDINATPGLARRSISIFSRRGPDGPDSSNFPLLPAMLNPQTQKSRRQSLWRRRLNLDNKNEGASVILHAVPPSPANPLPPLTALEYTMSTSLNEDISNAFGQGSSSVDWSSQSPVFRKDSVLQSPSSHKQKMTDSRIGVWRNGVTLWDEPKSPSSVLEIAGMHFPVPGPLTPPPHRPLPALPLPDTSAKRSISVVIPQSSVISPGTKPTKPRHSLSYFPVYTAAEIARENGVPLPVDESSIHPALRMSKSSSIEEAPFQFAKTSHSRDQSRTESIAISVWSASSGSRCAEESSDRMSCYSRHSSMTSVDDSEKDEGLYNPNWNAHAELKRSVSAAFSILSPVEAGVFNDQSPRRDLDVNPLSPTSEAAPSQDDDDNAAFHLGIDSAPSPTLSEAVNDLQAQLGSISEDVISDFGHQQCAPVIQPQTTTVQTPQRVPTVPKRSRKRHWRSSSATIAQATILESPASMLVRRQSAPIQQDATRLCVANEGTVKMRRTTSERLIAASAGLLERSGRLTASARAPVLIPRTTVGGTSLEYHDPAAKSDGSWSPAEAQVVLLHIMSGLHSLDDLNATARINKGMWQVYKENEMKLLRGVQRNESPAAWELREWSTVSFAHVDCDGTSSQPEHTPETYLSCVRRDQQVIEELKLVILKKCQTFLRPETAIALAVSDDVNTQRFNNAFYRIWCFSKIFGCEKGREDDVAGQVDWLKGGLFAHQQECGATVNANLEFDMASVLLNAPDYFAKGNPDGLNADQLYDMTELWNCLAVLLQGYGGRVEQARSSGVFDHCETSSTAIEEEDGVLEEWIAHILTLGPSVILELARFSDDQSAAGFKLAKFHGWTDWEPSIPGTSKGTFLKEPVAKLYEERLAATMAHENSGATEMKEVGRKRVASLAAEIKLARSSSTYRQRPLIDMAHERPMSVASVSGSTSPVRPETSSAPPHSHAVLQAMWSPRRISPIIEDRVETFNRLSLLTLDGVAHDTSERAIRKIMDMGFSASQAKEALRLTDMGDGLRVDRAVDLLLRQQ